MSDRDFDENCRLIVKNLPPKKDALLLQRLLLELFTQVGPVFKCSINKIGATSNIRSCYIDFVYEESVEYAVKALDGTRLFDKVLQYEVKVKPQLGSRTATGAANSRSPSSTTLTNSQKEKVNDENIMDVDDEGDNENDNNATSKASSTYSKTSNHSRSKSIGEIINIDAEKDKERDLQAQNAWKKNSQLSKSSGNLSAHSSGSRQNSHQQQSGQINNQSRSNSSGNVAVTPLFKMRQNKQNQYQGPPKAAPNFNNSMSKMYIPPPNNSFNTHQQNGQIIYNQGVPVQMMPAQSLSGQVGYHHNQQQVYNQSQRNYR